MLVGEQHVIDTDAELGDPIGDSLGSVDEKVAIGSFDKVAVGLDEAAGVGGDFHDGMETVGSDKKRPVRNERGVFDGGGESFCQIKLSWPAKRGEA